MQTSSQFVVISSLFKRSLRMKLVIPFFWGVFVTCLFVLSTAQDPTATEAQPKNAEDLSEAVPSEAAEETLEAAGEIPAESDGGEKTVISESKNEEPTSKLTVASDAEKPSPSETPRVRLGELKTDLEKDDLEESEKATSEDPLEPAPKPIHVALVSGCDSHMSSMTPMAYSLLHHPSFPGKYRVTFVTGAQCRDKADKLGADFYDTGVWGYPNESGGSHQRDISMGPLLYGFPAVESFVKDDRPDLIVAELFNVRVSLIAELNNIPYATMWAGATPHPAMFQDGQLLNAGIAGVFVPGPDNPKWFLDMFTALAFSQAAVVWGLFQKEANDLFKEKMKESGVLDKDFQDIFHICNSYPSLALAGPPIFPLKEVPEKLYIAGMQPTEIADPNKMSSELKSFIKNSDRDILYMALGTYAVFTDKQFDVVKGAFLKQKRFNVIWSHSAWTEEKDTKDSYDRTRLYIKNKQPQKEIFAHDKVKVFLSHCGASSMMEGVNNVKVFIGCPQMRDQDLTSQVIKRYDFGTVVSKSPSESEILKAVENIYQNMEKYRRNVAKVRHDSRIDSVKKLELFVDSMAERNETIMFDVEKSRYMPFWRGAAYLLMFFSTILGAALCPLILMCYCCCCRKKKAAPVDVKKTN